jgi:hypothetical protein
VHVTGRCPPRKSWETHALVREEWKGFGGRAGAGSKCRGRDASIHRTHQRKRVAPPQQIDAIERKPAPAAPLETSRSQNTLDSDCGAKTSVWWSRRRARSQLALRWFNQVSVTTADTILLRHRCRVVELRFRTATGAAPSALAEKPVSPCENASFMGISVVELLLVARAAPD